MKFKYYIGISIVILMATVSLYAQSYSSFLVGNTWRIALISMNGEVLQDNATTCMYSTKISFVSSSKIIVNRSCLPPKEIYYKLTNDLLILDNEDTLKITKSNSTSFETVSNESTTDNEGNTSNTIVKTSYEKE